MQRQWQVWKQGTQPSAVNVDASNLAASDAAPSTSDSKPEADESSKLSILGEGDVLDAKSGDDAAATLKELRNQVSLLKESTESKGQENSELKDRIQSLESMIKKQEDIISLQNEQLAQLQNSLTTSGTDSEQTTGAVEEVIEEANDVLEQAQETVAEATEEAVEKADQIIKPATVEPLPDFSGPIPEEFLTAEPGQDAQQPAEESLSAQAEVIEESVAEEQVVAGADVSQPSFIEGIVATLNQQRQNLLYAGGGVLALILAWLGIKRRKANQETRDIEASGLPAFADEPSVDEMLDETVIATPDSVDEALDELETVEADADESVLSDQASDGDAGSDEVLAEADVYISYGLYQQAEELLKEGLAKDPENAKYQFKLAEIYHGDKKSDDFVQHVESISSSYDKQSPEWSKIVAMGAALAPAHALFTDNSSGAADADQQGANDSDSANIEDFEVASEDLEDFDNDDLADDLDDNSLDFTFDDNNALSELDDTADANDAEANDELEESSTAILESELDVDAPDDATQAFDMSAIESNEAADDANSDATEVFMDLDQDEIENELNADVDHDSETEMLDESLASGIDLDDAINLDDNADSQAGVKVDNDLDEILDSDASETAMFDSSLFDVDSPEAQAFAEGAERVDEDTVSLEQVQENLTAELETLSFDNDDIDPESMEEDSLPTLQTSEIGKPDIDVDELDDNLAASETGTFERDMIAEDVTEQFDVDDVGEIDATMTDLGEFGDDYDLETPSVIEEVGTKLDLAKAFVDMGDEDAAKETLTEVIEQGDQTQIQEAKDLLDKLS